MGVYLPNEVEMECDGCGEVVDVDTTTYAGDPASVGVDDVTIEEMGWGRDGSDTFCPKCKEEE